MARAALASFNTNSVGLNDARRGDLSRQTFAPLNAAFKVIDDAASQGNQVAIDAVVRALQIRELQGNAIQCVGTLAGNGNDDALEILLNHEKYGFLLSSTVGALAPAAGNGNQKAIDFLAAVTKDPKQHALWVMIADGLTTPAGAGNAVAVDALIGMSTDTNSYNSYVRNATVRGLTGAAEKGNTKAAEALRAMALNR